MQILRWRKIPHICRGSRLIGRLLLLYDMIVTAGRSAEIGRQVRSPAGEPGRQSSPVVNQPVMIRGIESTNS
jgi:hypothetical protein